MTYFGDPRRGVDVHYLLSEKEILAKFLGSLTLKQRCMVWDLIENPESRVRDYRKLKIKREEYLTLVREVYSLLRHFIDDNYS